MRKSATAALTLLVVGLALIACSGPIAESPSEEADPPYGLITPAEAAALLGKRNGEPDFALLDIRTDAEIEAGHISGAEGLNFYDPSFRERLAELDRSKTYLIYCRTGNRTGQTVPLMKDLGFERVYDLGGGITEWARLRYPVCVGPMDGTHACTGGSLEPASSL